MRDMGWKIWLLISAGVFVVGGGVWALAYRTDNAEAEVALPKELTVEGIRENMASNEGMRSTMRSAMRNEELTDEQRRQARSNMRTAFREEMQARVDEYFDASPEEQNDILDQHIDEDTARMKDWEQRRKEWEREREKERKEGGEDAEERRWERPRPTQEERKARSESRNPDEMARNMAYFTAVRKRMQERGIEMPRGGRGFGGPPGGGGGRGGGRGGRRGP